MTRASANLATSLNWSCVRSYRFLKDCLQSVREWIVKGSEVYIHARRDLEHVQTFSGWLSTPGTGYRSQIMVL